MPVRQSAELTKRAIEAAEPGRSLWDGGTRGISGLCLRVTPAGSRSFVFRYRNAGGKQCWVTLGSFPALTVEQARSLASRKAAEVAAGVDPSKARKAFRTAPTVADLADYYLGTYASSKGLRAATVRDARDVLRMALPTIGRLKVADVTATDVRTTRGKVRADAVAAAKADAAERRKALGAAQAAVVGAERAIADAEEAGRKAGTLRLMLGARQRKAAEAARLAERAEELAQSGRAGVHQANRLRAVLSSMFTVAKREWGARPDNPCEGIQREHEEQRGRNLSEAEVGRLLEACRAYEVEGGIGTDAPGAADAVRLLLYTGARLREVLRAEWREFDLERGLWTKPSAHTKTKRLHKVELDGPALELLRDMHTRRPHARFLFPGEPRKGRPGKIAAEVRPRVDLKRPWAWIVREAELEDVRLHDLRRTLASFMLTEGASLSTVGKALGHTQVATTARYAHLGASVQGAALGAAGRRMAGLMSGERRSEVVRLS